MIHYLPHGGVLAQARQLPSRELARMITRRELPDTWETDGVDGIVLDREWLPWLDAFVDLLTDIDLDSGPRARAVALFVCDIASSASMLADAIRQTGQIQLRTDPRTDPSTVA